MNKLRILFFTLLLVFITVGSVLAQDGNTVVEATNQLQGIIGQFWERIQLASQDNILRMVLIVGGAILLLVGWRIYNFVIAIAGGLLGSLLAVTLINTDNTLISLIAMIIGSIIGGSIAVLLYYLAVFVMGAYVGVILTLQVISATALQLDPLLAAIFGGIMGGLILVALSFELLVILSSIVGGIILSLGLGLNSWWTLGFIAFGIIWQITLAKVAGYKVRRRPSRRLLLRDA